MIEGEFESLLCTAQPRAQVFKLAAAMMKDLWERKQANVAGEMKALWASLAEIEKQVDQFVDRIVETSVPAVVRALETKVERLEKDKLLVQERIAQGAAPQGEFNDRLRAVPGHVGLKASYPAAAT